MKDEFLPTEGAPLVLDIQLRDPQGRLVQHIHRPSQSYLYNFMRFINISITPATQAGAGSYKATGTSGNLVYLRPGQNAVTGGAGSLACLVVGGGTNTLFGTSFRLGSFIYPGTLSNNLNFGAGAIGATTVSAGTVDIRYQRAFTNNSGSAVRVREAGWLRRQTSPAGAHLFIRDLVGGAGIRVGTLASLTVSYTLRTVR